MVKEYACISRAQAGDEEAFAELMRAYYAYVYTVVIKIVNNPHDAEEVVQETFLNVYRGLPQLADRTKFKGWLAEIARNRAHNWRREQKVETVSIDEVSEHTLQNPDALDEQLIRREQQELIRRAMDTLSEQDREIARSYYLDGASYDELIQTHGLSYKAISVRLSRAKQKLVKRLAHLLTAIFVPPATTLKQIYSGGLIAMKIGTAPKITIGIIGIIALIFIGFIGSRQLLSSKDNVSQSVEAAGQTSDMTAEQVAQTDASRQNATTPSPEAERPISEEERQQIKNFFGQFEESDVQSETVTPQSETESESEDESISTDTAVELPTPTEQTAEEVMNTFIEAFRNFDVEALLLLTTGTVREEVETFEGDMEEILENIPDEMEQQVLDTIFETFRQIEVTNTEYVGDQFHFWISAPSTKIQSPEMRHPTGSSRFSLSSSSAEQLVKMQKVDGAWRIYELGGN